MSEGRDKPPDFAMARAVEILATIYERSQRTGTAPPAPSDRPLLLFNESLTLDVTRTTRDDVQRALGGGFAYPARGWHTYAVRGARGERLFLSAFYSGTRLIAAELYVPKTNRAPNLQARDLRFRLLPGEIEVGTALTTLPEPFGPVSAVAERLGAYDTMFEARFPGGTAYAMGNGGIIERLALYALSS